MRRRSRRDPGWQHPLPDEQATLQAVADAAAEHSVRLFLIVYPRGSSATPLSPTARAQFASYTAALTAMFPSLRDVIVGNEPNLNRFWLPQFGRWRRDVAAPAYLALLAETYDAVKAAREDVRSGAAPPRRAGSTARTRAGTPTRRRRSSVTWGSRIAGAGETGP